MGLGKWILAGVLCVASPQSRAEIGTDKYYHAGYSFVYGVAASAITDNKTTAFALAMTPGLIKEIADSQEKGNKFSFGDLAADAVGAYLGVQVGHWLFYPTKRGIQVKYNFK